MNKQMSLRERNDWIRRNPANNCTKVLISNGVLLSPHQEEILKRVAFFDDFSPDDTEHYFGDFFLGGNNYVFQISNEPDGGYLLLISTAAEFLRVLSAGLKAS